MPPYEKRQDSQAIDDGWTISDDVGEIIAHVDTESMADALMSALLIDTKKYATACWVSGDVLSKAEELNMDMTEQEAEDFLRENASQIQQDMVERGWDSIATLLSMKD